MATENINIADTAENEQPNTGENTETETKQSEFEKKLNEMLQNAFLRGMSYGGKSFVGVIYELIVEGRNKRMNPAKILLKVQKECQRMLSISNKNIEKEMPSAETDTDGKSAESDKENVENDS